MNRGVRWEQVEAWAQLIRHLPVSIIATDAAGTVKLWNDAATLLFGWSAEETVGRSITELTVGPSEAEVAEAIMNRVRDLSVWEGEFAAQHRDGRTVDIHIINSPIVEPGGQLVGIVGISVDVSTQRQLALEARDQAQALADLTSLLLETERARVASELHDDLGQCLTAARSALFLLRHRGESERGELLDRVEALLADGQHSVRRICDGLRPRLLDEVGVLDALEAMLADFGERTGVSCTLSFDRPDLSDIGRTVELLLFRVAQEALTNIERHADGVAHVQIEVTSDTDPTHADGAPSGLTLRIVNDGLPYDGKHGFGIIGMQQRAATAGGRFSMSAGLRGGSELVLHVPVTLAEEHIADHH